MLRVRRRLTLHFSPRDRTPTRRGEHTHTPTRRDDDGVVPYFYLSRHGGATTRRRDDDARGRRGATKKRTRSQHHLSRRRIAVADDADADARARTHAALDASRCTPGLAARASMVTTPWIRMTEVAVARATMMITDVIVSTHSAALWRG